MPGCPIRLDGFTPRMEPAPSVSKTNRTKYVSKGTNVLLCALITPPGNGLAWLAPLSDRA